jgi:sugar lactone lactonase YvrE
MFPFSASLRISCARVTGRTPQFLCFVAILLACVLPTAAQNKINTVAGGGFNSSLNADLPAPTAVTEDASGNLYIAAPPSQYVYEWNKTSGAVTVFAGVGYISYHHITQKATTSPLWSPSGLAVDSHGNVYIADAGNNSIRKVDTSGNMSTVAGTSKPCYQTACGDGGLAIDAKLSGPQGVAIDKAGNIYIADTGDNRVRCVVGVATGCNTNKTIPIGTIVNYAGNPTTACASSTDPCGDGGKSKSAYLNTPMGVALDKAGNLYIADTQDHRIRKVSKAIITTIAGTGVRCGNGTEACGDAGAATSAELAAPRAVSVDGAGNIYIADTGDQRIRTVTGTTINAFAGTGKAGFSGDSGAPLSAEMTAPNGIYVDAAGTVFISDTGNQRIRTVVGGTSGKITTFMGGGNGGDGTTAVEYPPTAATPILAEPYQVAVDASNNFYIADTANNRIRVVNTQSSAITVAGVVVQPGDIQTVAGTGNVGYSGDNGPAVDATLHSPFGVAVDANGNIYIADSDNGIIREVDGSTGTITSLSATNALTLPSALSIDKNGNIFIADPPAQVVWELSGGSMNVVAGNGTAGYSGDGGVATAAEVDVPFGVAVDSNENLFIADAGNNVIRCVLGVKGGCGAPGKGYNPGTIVTYAFTGGYNFGGDGFLATKAARWFANEVYVDARGNLFIGGGNDALVQRVDLAAQTVLTVAGVPTEWWYYGYTGENIAATAAHINNIGLAVDSNENLLIADAGNNVIRRVPLIGVAHLNHTGLNFGKVTVGTKSGPMEVTLQNTGADDFAIASIVLSQGDFSQTNNCPLTPTTIPPSNAANPMTCTFTVYFTPTQKGTRNATITINDNAFGKQQVIKLTGVGD